MGKKKANKVANQASSIENTHSLPTPDLSALPALNMADKHISDTLLVSESPIVVVKRSRKNKKKKQAASPQPATPEIEEKLKNEDFPEAHTDEPGTSLKKKKKKQKKKKNPSPESMNAEISPIEPKNEAKIEENPLKELEACEPKSVVKNLDDTTSILISKRISELLYQERLENLAKQNLMQKELKHTQQLHPHSISNISKIESYLNDTQNSKLPQNKVNNLNAQSESSNLSSVTQKEDQPTPQKTNEFNFDKDLKTIKMDGSPRRDSKLDIDSEITTTDEYTTTPPPLETVTLTAPCKKSQAQVTPPRFAHYENGNRLVLTIYKSNVDLQSVSVTFSDPFFVSISFMHSSLEFIRMNFSITKTKISQEVQKSVTKRVLEIVFLKESDCKAEIDFLEPPSSPVDSTILPQPTSTVNDTVTPETEREELPTAEEKVIVESPVDSGYGEGPVLKIKNIGLWNMGNTCYLNSVVQCLMTIDPFVNYFLDGSYVSDINTNNPLSDSKGEMVKSFATLAKSLATENDAVDPSRFYRCLLTFSSQFEMHEQHDAQEFLQHLLDSIHEDVNKIIKKPYIELPEYDETTNDAFVASEYWSAHKARNDSVVVDEFQGMYRSVMRCGDCGHSSIKFDPYMSLTLELPLAAFEFQILYVTKELKKFMVRMKLYVENPRILHVKEELGRLASVNPTSIIAFYVPEDDFRSVVSDEFELLDAGINVRYFKFYEIIPGNAILLLRNMEMKVESRYVKRFKSGSDQVNPDAISEESFFSEDDLEYRDAIETFDDSVTQTPPSELHSRTTSSDSFESFNSSEIKEATVSKLIIGEAAYDARQRSMLPDSDDEISESEIVEIPEYHGMFNTFGFPNVISVEPGRVSQRELSDKIMKSLLNAGIISEMYKMHPLRIWLTINNEPGDDDEFELEGDSFHTGFVGWETFENYDRMADYHLQKYDVPPRPTIELQDCIEQHLKEEDVHWRCTKCPPKTSSDDDVFTSTKKLDLWSMPKQVLIVHLKRFAQNPNNPNYWNKREELVHFPGVQENDYLEIATLNGQKEKFELIGVVNHYGNMTQGHYTACCKRGDRWFTFDDDSVIPISEDRVCSKNAYVLFFQHVSK